MKTGTARQGMRVRIIGNHNSHGFKIGQIVALGEQSWHEVNRYGHPFYASTGHGSHYIVREADIEPAGAKVV